MMHRLLATHARSRGRWLLIVLAASWLGGCSGVLDPITDPTLPTPMHEIEFLPGERVTITGDILPLAVSVTPDPQASLVWTATAGTIEGSGDQVTFVAPDEPGIYVVDVMVEGDLGSRTSVTVEVPGPLLEPFTLIVIPDTQNMIRSSTYAPMVDAMAQWVLDEREERNIAFVTHVGDIVSDASSATQWNRARNALDRLHGVVPYAVALGNHEYSPHSVKDGPVDNYLTHFGPARYAGMPWYRGSHASGLSHYQVFEAGGREFLHLSLEWEPTGTTADATTPLGWAHAVLSAHPDLPTIVTTHAYLWDQIGAQGHFPDEAKMGRVTVGGTTTYPGASGVELFDTLVYPFAQVFMVVNGHWHRARDGDDIPILPDNGQYHQVSTNAAGLPVFEMLSNYQSWERGGDGWLRMVEFQPRSTLDAADRIEVRTYSPVRDAEGAEAWLTDGRSRFSFDVDLAARFAQP